MNRRLSLCLCLAFLLALGVPAAAIAAGGKEPTPVVVRALASGGWRTQPVRQARVRVFHGGRLVGRGAVGARGVTIVRARVRPGSALRVVVSGGRVGRHRFGGRLLADVAGYRFPRTVFIDPVTTLAARFADAHPDLPARRVRRRTKRFLDLPGFYVIGRDGRTDVSFDGRRFFATAGTGRHFDRFVAHLVRQMGSGRAHRSFARPAAGQPPRGGARASAVEVGGADGAFGALTEAIVKGEGVFKMLDDPDTVMNFANLVLAISGGETQDAMQRELGEMRRQLEQIQESIAIVEQTVEDLQHENQGSAYSQAVADVDEQKEAVTSAEVSLESAAALSVEEGCLSSDPGPRCDEVAGMITGPAGFMENFSSSGLKTPAQLNSFAAKIGGDAVPSAPAGLEGVIQFASALTTGGSGQLFYRQADSERLREAVASWVTSYTEALGLAASYWRREGANKATIETDVEETAQDAGSMPASLPRPLPEGTAIDMTHGLMWSTDLSGQGTAAVPYATLAAEEWEYRSGPEEWESTKGLTLGGTGGGSGRQLPFADWRIAGQQQIEALLEAVAPQGSELPGEAIRSQGEFEWGAILPGDFGYGHVPGLEIEYIEAGWERKGCHSGPSACYWPVWVGNGNAIGNLHFREGPHTYVDGTFHDSDPFAIKWDGLELWGDNNEGSVYGPLETSEIPYLFYRPVQSGECYYYPPPGHPTGGSPGCPD
jgi:hypothetical protein